MSTAAAKLLLKYLVD